MLAVAGVVAALGIWLVWAQGSVTPETQTEKKGAALGSEPTAVRVTAPEDRTAPASGSRAASDVPLTARVPAQRIPERGRLSIDADSLRDGDVLALGLALPDPARGEEPRTVRIASVDGRRLETTAAPAAGSGSGLRLEIDPEWLTPGLYMIEVRTAEKTHFPLRRYVLEVLPTTSKPEPGTQN